MQLVELPFATAIGKGNLLLEGNLEAGKASGALLVERADLSIPDKIPRPLPQLPVRIRNPQKPLPLRSLPAPSPYPLFLDLSIDAPDSVFVTGRGLSSEWNGAFQIDGRLDAISARGSLKLSSGEFSFSNRSFKLTDGSLTFTGRHKEMPTLDLSGTITQKGVAITARLKGPLNNPQITFQSVPPLPTGSILSYLLFGQDISEVTGFQALQLANTIASLSGASPDLLENTRRSLGVDRLRIITKSSSGDEGTDSIAVEVGKYVAEGVLVSFSQGTDDSSTNIRIEVDLKNGFTFEAETEQQQEQGIFSLKYNLNY
jgi:translocation and assembly module TamB